VKAQKLFEILNTDQMVKVIGSLDFNVTGIKTDSRDVNPGNVFVAVKGVHVDGHDYIQKAIKSGACIVVCEKLPKETDEVTFVQVKSSQGAVGFLAHKFFGNDEEDLVIVGVTGTNGKSTIVSLLHQLFTKLGKKVGLISTIHNIVGERSIKSTHTTPDPIALAALIAEMREASCSHIFMEVSSHGLDQQRVNGINFTATIFTNITHDHLNYHGSMLNYIRAKKKLFDGLSHDAVAIINMDDKNGSVMIQNSKAVCKSYALKSMADYKCKLLEDSLIGLHIKINQHDLFCRLSGEFNAYNLTAVYATAIELGENEEELIRELTNLQGVEGRMQKVMIQEGGVVGIVDYAHSPDALENVLKTISKTKPKNGKIITVIGCGGDRDKTKRPLMAKIAVGYSDRVVLTSDNPRSEDPESILDDMEAAVKSAQRSRVVRITDRRSAIKAAVMFANGNDVVLVAGKGHEKYQEINGVRYPFEDKKVLLSAMKGE
jgi:UDP-N-acetylmuramoyl-L-alanyl-D-glutamate--2,6-diaminopimelate ligase